MIQLPSEPKIISQEDNKATFEIGPLYPGYGATIGNSLRRVLLSSLEGAAITSVKITGVPHEFTTIPNVLEDVINIIINLKLIRFKFYGTEPVTLTLEAKGEKQVKAGDIKTNSDVEIINKDQHIATLTDKKAELIMELQVERGLGYLSVEQRQKEKLPIGVIAVDAIFGPIKHANFKIENMRVGQRTDYNKVVLEIETDGSISPQEALNKSAEILTNHFDTIKVEVEKEKEKELKADKEEKETKEEKKEKKKKVSKK